MLLSLTASGGWGGCGGGNSVCTFVIPNIISSHFKWYWPLYSVVLWFWSHFREGIGEWVAWIAVTGKRDKSSSDSRSPKMSIFDSSYQDWTSLREKISIKELQQPQMLQKVSGIFLYLMWMRVSSVICLNAAVNGKMDARLLYLWNNYRKEDIWFNRDQATTTHLSSFYLKHLLNVKFVQWQPQWKHRVFTIINHKNH